LSGADALFRRNGDSLKKGRLRAVEAQRPPVHDDILHLVLEEGGIKASSTRLSIKKRRPIQDAGCKGRFDHACRSWEGTPAFFLTAEMG
jgi:hypothetical protein